MCTCIAASLPADLADSCVLCQHAHSCLTIFTNCPLWECLLDIVFYYINYPPICFLFSQNLGCKISMLFREACKVDHRYNLFNILVNYSSQETKDQQDSYLLLGCHSLHHKYIRSAPCMFQITFQD